MTNRPSGKELCGKVRNAIEALREDRRGFGTMRHWPQDRETLDLESVGQLWVLIPELLEEINKAGPEMCYAGTHPPQKSYQEESVIKDAELWAFAWESARLGKRMYLKFVLKKCLDGWYFFYINCHPDASK